MQREVLPDGTILFVGPTGCAVIQRLAPGALLLTGVGDFESPSSSGPMQEFDNELERSGSLSIFLNMTERKIVANSSREAWTRWARKHREHLQAYLLVRSKLVDMAITVLAMLAGGVPIKSFSDQAVFEAAIAAHVPGFKRLPPLPAKARAISVASA